MSALFQTNKFEQHGNSHLQAQEILSPPITAWVEVAPSPGAPCCCSAHPQHSTAPCRHSCQFSAAASFLSTLLFLGGWSWPSSACSHHPQCSSFCGNSLLTGSHKGRGCFWKQTPQEELTATTNSSFVTKYITQPQPGLPASLEHQKRSMSGGILSDRGETDWASGYTNTAVYKVLQGRTEPKVVFKLWTLILLKSFRPCGKDGWFAVVCWTTDTALPQLHPCHGAASAAATAPHIEPRSLTVPNSSRSACNARTAFLSSHSSHARFNEDTQHTWKKWLKERDEFFKLTAYLFSPLTAITWMLSSDTNPYQITEHQLWGAETRSELCFSPNQLGYKH